MSTLKMGDLERAWPLKITHFPVFSAIYVRGSRMGG